MSNSHGDIVRQWRPHPVAQWAQTLLGCAATAATLWMSSFLYGLLFAPFASAYYPSQAATLLGWTIVGPCVLVSAIIGIGTLAGAIGYFRTRYTLHINRVSDIAPRGLLGTSFDEIYFKAIKSVSYSQSTLGRIFGYRTIELEREGKDTIYTMSAVPDDMGLLEYFQRIAANNMGSATQR